MADDEVFSVVFDAEGFYHTSWIGQGAEAAVMAAKELADAADGDQSVEVRLIDAEDFTVFQWIFGRGVIYPPPPGARSFGRRSGEELGPSEEGPLFVTSGRTGFSVFLAFFGSLPPGSDLANSCPTFLGMPSVE